MSRRNRFRRPLDPNSGQQPEQAGAEAAVEGEERHAEESAPRGDESVITLRLGGRNPLKCFNAYLIPGSRYTLVDPGPPGTAGELLEQISRHRVALRDIGLIVLTHGHPDHFGNAAQLKAWTQAPLAVHELDAEYVNFGSVPVLKPVTRLGTLFKSRFALKSDSAEPDIMLHDGDRLNRYAGKGRVISTPGHTAGSISILLPDGMCIAGDLLMRGLRARSPSIPWFAEDATEVRESLQKLVNAGARTLLVGHGGPFSIEQLAQCFPWLELPEGESMSDAEDSAQVSQEGAERRRRRRPRRRRPGNRADSQSASDSASRNGEAP